MPDNTTARVSAFPSDHEELATIARELAEHVGYQITHPAQDRFNAFLEHRDLHVDLVRAISDAQVDNLAARTDAVGRIAFALGLTCATHAWRGYGDWLREAVRLAFPDRAIVIESESDDPKVDR